VGEDVEVRREDQENINKFSRLHQRSAALEEGLKQKQVRPVHLFSSTLVAALFGRRYERCKRAFWEREGVVTWADVVL
jgi:hypothetical protein